MLRVLVAEDNGSFRETILQVVSAIGAGTVVAAVGDGEAAEESALRLQPDVAFLDVGLPGKNGLEVARRLRLVAPKLRVVLLLSDDRPSYRAAAAECGAAWIAKDRLAEELGPFLGDLSSGSEAR
ncbi:MAG: response regulator transcription factor [Armatimonadetes bacterium]|nr:response regulator transcription factor [Armatimonadota bacterium]